MKIIKGIELKHYLLDYREMEQIYTVKEIIQNVRENGDDAVKQYTLKYDGITLPKIRLNVSEINAAYRQVDNTLISSIKHAASNIEKFAKKQMKQFKDFKFEISPGVVTGQMVIPIERVGVYVPGGRFPLFSTLLMCAIPARVAGVSEIAVCSPPSCDGSIHPAILVAAGTVGVDEIYEIGGVQAIAAMAYGTQTIKKVDKIVGPGNKYVTLAKKEVFGTVGIDFIAGPTEIMIIADETANPEILAADLLAQAEHDIEALPILITTCSELAEKVNGIIDIKLRQLKTRDIANISVEKNGIIAIVSDLDEAVHIANKKAPEHLELQIRNPEHHVSKFKNYGSLFIGELSAEALGDYSSGLNHTLPTNSSARYTGGLSVADFLKLQTTLKVTKDGLSAIGPIAKTLAEAEGLDGHAKSATIRMRN